MAARAGLAAEPCPPATCRHPCRAGAGLAWFRQSGRRVVVEASSQLGHLLALLGRFDEALASAGRAVALPPRAAAGWTSPAPRR